MSIQFFFYVEGVKASILAFKESAKSNEDRKIFKEVLSKYTETIINDLKENPHAYRDIDNTEYASTTTETIDKIVNGICENNIYSRMSSALIIDFLRHVIVGNYIKSLVPVAPDPPTLE